MALSPSLMHSSEVGATRQPDSLPVGEFWVLAGVGVDGVRDGMDAAPMVFTGLVQPAGLSGRLGVFYSDAVPLADAEEEKLLPAPAMTWAQVLVPLAGGLHIMTKYSSINM
ncbi:hypothetical protein P4O66_002010 [Electrophorus voltai]|uniref:Uncharacterized protein n=1 Tax=Electrophorus voltai TaxID=2609070 RepID=A0AAD8ZWZ3_9TELE|nr:hypothetical protein P4O66_002010 [Electrophorus voltai]